MKRNSPTVWNEGIEKTIKDIKKDCIATSQNTLQANQAGNSKASLSGRRDTLMFSYEDGVHGRQKIAHVLMQQHEELQRN